MSGFPRKKSQIESDDELLGLPIGIFLSLYIIATTLSSKPKILGNATSFDHASKLAIRRWHLYFIFLVTIADKIDLNPSSTSGEVKKKRNRPVDTPQESGILLIRVHSVILRRGKDTFTKSRHYRDFRVPEGEKIVSSPDAETLLISAGILHGIVVNFFCTTALETISKITSGDGDVTEHSLIGDGHADYNVILMITSISQIHDRTRVVTNLFDEWRSLICPVHFLMRIYAPR